MFIDIKMPFYIKKHLSFFFVSRVAIERETPEQVTVEHTVSDLCSVVRKPESHIASQLRWIDKLALQCSLKNIVPKHSVSLNSPIKPF